MKDAIKGILLNIVLILANHNRLRILDNEFRADCPTFERKRYNERSLTVERLIVGECFIIPILIISDVLYHILTGAASDVCFDILKVTWFFYSIGYLMIFLYAKHRLKKWREVAGMAKNITMKRRREIEEILANERDRKKHLYLLRKKHVD